MYEDTRSWCWLLRWETVQRLCGLVCISRERYTAGVWRAYRKVYRGIQKGIQGGGGKINIQWRGPLYVPQKTELSKVADADEILSPLLIFKNKALIQILNKQKGNTKCKLLFSKVLKVCWRSQSFCKSSVIWFAKPVRILIASKSLCSSVNPIICLLSFLKPYPCALQSLTFFNASSLFDETAKMSKL